MHWIPLSGEPGNDEVECFILRMGYEEILVHDGVLVDCDGRDYNREDFVRLLPVSKHSSHTLERCLLLVILRGNNRALGEDELGGSE